MGETEESLRAKGVAYVAGRVSYADNPRGRIVGDEVGFLKLLFRADDMRLVGVHVMTETDNIVLEHLRHICGAIDDVRDDIREIKQRAGNLENQYANMSNRLDRMDVRIERIERRLDLTDA